MNFSVKNGINIWLKGVILKNQKSSRNPLVKTTEFAIIASIWTNKRRTCSDNYEAPDDEKTQTNWRPEVNYQTSTPAVVFLNFPPQMSQFFSHNSPSLVFQPDGVFFMLKEVSWLRPFTIRFNLHKGEI